MPLIKINTASLEELIALPGIGEARAKQIIDFRTNISSINSVAQLMEVTGLNEENASTLGLQIDWRTNDQTVINTDTESIESLLQWRVVFFKIDLSNIGFKSLAGFKLQINYFVAARTDSSIGFNFPFFLPSQERRSYTITDFPTEQVVEGSILYDLQQPIVGHYEIALYTPNNQKLFSESTATISDYTVKFVLPAAADEEPPNLTIQLTNYEHLVNQNYKLEIERRSKLKSEKISSFKTSVALPETAAYEFIPPPDEEIQQIQLSIVSPDDVIIKSTGFLDWDDDVKDQDSSLNIELEIPAPERLNTTIQIEKLAEGETLPALPWANHRFFVSYEITKPNSSAPISHEEKELPISRDGTVIIEIEYYGQIQQVKLQIFSPNGEILNQEIVSLEAINGQEYTIPIPARKVVDTTEYEILPTRPIKTVGRLIARDGKTSLSGVQVIIYATKEVVNDEEQEPKYHPILVTLTETDGYFVFDTPQEAYADAYAIVGQVSNERIPIRLEKDKVLIREKDEDGIVTETTIEKRFFLNNLILVVDTEDEHHPEACDCDDCGSLDFHQPHRVLEEFSYYSVVRTSEPEIKGFTLEEEGTITIGELSDLLPISSQISNLAPSGDLNSSIRKSILQKHLNSKKGLTAETLKKAILENETQNLKEFIRPQKQIRALGRFTLDANNVIDWDEDPTIYQATTIAFGHLLQYKQEWVNDGYSLGEPIYSLPLAPGQKKQIVVFDWERRESASRTEELDYTESLNNSLSRNRDVHEIVDGVLTERIRAGSRAKTSSTSAGFGGGFLGSGFGALLGISGGKANSSSSAWQNSARRSSLNDLQSLRDKTIQSANATRSQRSTVVQTASQGERFSAETEVVANYNHCHAITVVYFEILRHFKIEHRLTAVQECLFVPMIMTTFDNAKILRWREILVEYLLDDSVSRIGTVYNGRYRPISNKLSRGFAAIERIENEYEGSDLPPTTFAEGMIEKLEGELFIKFEIGDPGDLTAAADREAVENQLKDLLFLPSRAKLIDLIFNQQADKRNRFFQEYVAPQIAYNFVHNLKIYANGETELPLDLTLISKYQNNRPLHVSVRQAKSINLSRESIQSITIKLSESINLGPLSVKGALPANSQIILERASLRYRTKHYSGYLLRNSFIKNDIVSYGGQNDGGAYIPTQPTAAERRNPRNEDRELATSLKDHLNDNIEYYHKAIWFNMTPERRYMLLDGIQVTDYSDANYPNGIVRSGASVVENRVIGVAGNSLIMPVAPGYRLDATLRGVKEDLNLVSLYKPLTPLEPTNVSIPTKGVFAEAIIGQCNSCEKIDETRFWRWSEEPIPDEPTAILPIDSSSRRANHDDLTSSGFANPMIVQQNAPAVPDPQGFGTLSQLLGTSSFENLTGLDANQRNAIEALKASYQTTQAFGSQAAKLAALSKVLDSKLSQKDKDKIVTELTKSIAQESTNVGVEDRLEQVKRVNEMVNKGEIHQSQGKQITQGIIDNMSKSGQGLVDKPEMRRALINASQDPNSNIRVRTADQEAEIQRGVILASAPISPYIQPSQSVSDSLDWETIRATIVDLAISEEVTWTKQNGKKYKEVDSQMRSALEEYWTAAGLADSVDSLIDNRTAWSAAFISWCVRTAGVPEGRGFDFGPSHIRYIVGALRNRLGGDLHNRFWLFGIDEVAPRLGDIVCNIRGDADWNFSSLINDYWGEGGGRANVPIAFAPGHCDIVTKINSHSIIATGGNVGDSVSNTTISTKNDGLIDTSVSNDKRAIIRILSELDVARYSGASTYV